MNQIIDEQTSKIIEAQHQLFETSKLASIGVLAGGVAHELNNPLAVVQVAVDILENLLESDINNVDEFQQNIDRINNNIERMVGIINNLLALGSKNNEVNIVISNIHKIIDDVLFVF